MRTFSAKSVVVVAALAGASVSGWAKVSTQQGGQQDMLSAQAQTGMQRAVVSDHPGLQTAAFYPSPATLGRPQADSVATATAVQEPAPGQEKANMGMMILVGLGMVGTLIVKSNRS